MCAFFYVHLNIEIIKSNYSINNNQKELSYFLDQHRRLLYNLSKLKSPLALDKRLYVEKIHLVESNANNIYYASIEGTDDTSAVIGSSNKTSIIDRVLDTFTEKAEARTATP